MKQVPASFFNLSSFNCDKILIEIAFPQISNECFLKKGLAPRYIIEIIIARSKRDSPQGSKQAIRSQPALAFIFEFL